MLSNCAIAALAAWLRHPFTTRVRVVRTRSRLRHVIWERGGHRFEFYAADRPASYLRNALYSGEVRQIFDRSMAKDGVVDSVKIGWRAEQESNPRTTA